MKRKLFGFVFALALMAGSYLAWAVVLPQPTSWTMYQVGPSGVPGMPYLTAQQDAADAYFQFYTVGNPTKGCYRYFWGNSRSGPFTDKRWADNKWIDCTWSGTAYTYTNSDVSIAPPINCNANSSTRCLLIDAAANGKNIGCVKCRGEVQVGNPIDVGTGNKYQVEVDFEVPGSPWLSFVRHYNSSTPAALGLGMGAQWRHSLTYRLVKTTSGHTDLYRPDGSVKRFAAGAGPDADETGVLEYVLNAQGDQTGWTYDTGSGQVETYDMRGRITQIAFQSGGGLTYAYADATTDVPSSVTDHFGRSLQFTYDTSNRLTKVVTPAGAEYSYTYVSNLLTQATRPGGALRKYVYDETSYDATGTLTGQLTGIVDESNTRFATFKYDKYNRAYSSEHAGGVEKFTVSYANDGVTNTVTSPLASAKQYGFQQLLGVFRETTSSTTCTDGSCGQTGASTYDAYGNRTSLVGENGVKTCFAYDTSRNLMTRQVDGLAASADCSAALSTPPAGSRVTSITWHASLRKPAMVAVPLKVTAFGYDAAGRVTSVAETPTADATGAQGASAQATGSPRQVVYAYNASGQLLSVTGPRASQATTFEYDTAGNLFKSTNAGGQVTTYSSFDADGRPGSMVLPSGALVTLQYDARGRLSTLLQEGESTVLGYNGMNLLTSATLPNGETLTYGYDTAQRLTSVTDARGQKVSYTLNSAGQPTVQQVLYANSTVAVSASRVFDMLGRLKQVTGAQRM